MRVSFYEITYRRILDGDEMSGDIYTEKFAAPASIDPMLVLEAFRKKVTSEKWPWTDDEGERRMSAVTGFTLLGFSVLHEDVDVLTEAADDTPE